MPKQKLKLTPQHVHVNICFTVIISVLKFGKSAQGSVLIETEQVKERYPKSPLCHPCVG